MLYPPAFDLVAGEDLFLAIFKKLILVTAQTTLDEAGAPASQPWAEVAWRARRGGHQTA